ncbi:sigma-70 family RNA polymerase sigma factor [Paenarthrobacter sp. OM7]|uniref:sigma-70 family RNA polymerase sigma factor n=1 Tax=Paenarthrobacter sp. OM7 TaxID=3041264 RepID=UPI002468903D|nr:sigma-70 family RNA polymerase sigma factor [Paenarthrobacter sp. OM7]WGM19958.1 sigma-70 family RNA polymerase sigma factor [Paenarthrobacter sp. OM7]
MREPAAPAQEEVGEPSDEDLIRSVEGNDAAAIENLYRRHVPAARAFAKRLVGNDFDSDDITSEAFLKAVSAIQRGNGPTGPFRPYLLRAVRTSAADHWNALSRHDLVEDTAETPEEETGYDHVLNEADRKLASTAFASLPPRWQTVLWHVDVEGEPPRNVGPLLGLEPNAVSAVAARARKGLRQAYLEAYIASSLDEKCKPYLPLLAKSVLEGLSPAEDLRLQNHLTDCPACSSAILSLADARSTMRRAVAPWLLGIAAGSPVLEMVGPETAQPHNAEQSKDPEAGLKRWVVGVLIAFVAALAAAAVALSMVPGQPTALPAGAEEKRPATAPDLPPAGTPSQAAPSEPADDPDIALPLLPVLPELPETGPEPESYLPVEPSRPILVTVPPKSPTGAITPTPPAIVPSAPPTGSWIVFPPPTPATPKPSAPSGPASPPASSPAPTLSPTPTAPVPAPSRGL